MDADKLKAILAQHKIWLESCGEKGERADLRGADLREAYLQGAYLQGADLREADLREAYLQGADLREAYLQGADLQGADLREADLEGADLDFSCWPLWCGSKGVKVDIKLVRQLLAHIACLDCTDKEFAKIKKAIMLYAIISHRAEDLGLINYRLRAGEQT